MINLNEIKKQDIKKWLEGKDKDEIVGATSLACNCIVSNYIREVYGVSGDWWQGFNPDDGEIIDDYPQYLQDIAREFDLTRNGKDDVDVTASQCLNLPSLKDV